MEGIFKKMNNFHILNKLVSSLFKQLHMKISAKHILGGVHSGEFICV